MKNILVVDDDPFTCDMVSRVLSGDHCVHAVHDGNACMRLLKTTPCDLIILDIVMPDEDGFDVMRRLRANHATTLIPVMFLTGSAREADRVLGFRLGADDFLMKPFHAEELRERVKRALRRAEHMGSPLPADDATGFRGSMADFGLASLLTMLAMENKTGFLHLVGEGRHMVLHLRAGQVVRARTLGDADDTSYQTVFQALGMKAGTFYFVAGEVTDPDELDQSTSQLLLEVAQQMDERRGGHDWLDDTIS